MDEKWGRSERGPNETKAPRNSYVQVDMESGVCMRSYEYAETGIGRQPMNEVREQFLLRYSSSPAGPDLVYGASRIHVIQTADDPLANTI